MSSIPVSAVAAEAEASIGLISQHAGYLSALTAALEAADVGAAASASTPEELAANAPGVGGIVVWEDADSPELLESVRRTREAFPDAAVVAVWPAERSGDARKALRAGADGLVGEDEIAKSLSPTLRAARSGVICVPRLLRTQLESESLSMREQQVLGMVTMGCTNAEIAAKLYLAESTVKSHLSSACSKLGVRSRRDAASMVLDPAEGLGPGILAIAAA